MRKFTMFGEFRGYLWKWASRSKPLPGAITVDATKSNSGPHCWYITPSLYLSYDRDYAGVLRTVLVEFKWLRCEVQVSWHCVM